MSFVHHPCSYARCIEALVTIDITHETRQTRRRVRPQNVGVEDFRNLTGYFEQRFLEDNLAF